MTDDSMRTGHLGPLDFDLEIGPRQGRNTYALAVRSPAGEARATMRFPFQKLALENRLKDLELVLLRSSGRRYRALSPEEQTVQEFGRALFEALLTDDIRGRYEASLEHAFREGKELRLKLRILPPELAALPWEFLYDPRQREFVCLNNVSIVRYLNVSRPILPLNVSPPLKILGMVASPRGLPPLNVEDEKQRVEAAIKDLRAAGLVELEWLPGQTWRDLQRYLRKGAWHIFHFIGHGGFDRNSESGLIVMADEQSDIHRFPATSLGRLLDGHRSLKLVLLNSCEGARGSESDVFSSTAAALVGKGIPAVLAMQYEITDEAAIEFARSFYEAIADGLPVDTAVGQARESISLALPNTVEWGTPVLYMHSPDGVLFKFQQPTLNSQEVERQRREETARLAQEQRERELAQHAAEEEERRAIEREAERLEQERLEREQLARENAERRRREETARLENERRERELAQQAAQEEERRAIDSETARLEQERLAHEESARLAQERRERDEIARLENERREGELAQQAAKLEQEKRHIREQVVRVLAAKLEQEKRHIREQVVRVLAAKLAKEYYERGLQVQSPQGQPQIAAAHSSTKLVGPVPVDIAPADELVPPSKARITPGNAKQVKLLQTLTEHKKRVHGVAFAPDGQMLASAGGGYFAGDKGVRVWRVTDSSMLYMFTGHTDEVTSLTFAPDGQVIASGGGAFDRSILLWRPANGKLLHKLTGHSTTVYSVAFAADGQTLASGSADKTVRLWRVTSGKLIQTLSGHSGSVQSIAFAPDSQILASGSIDKSIRLWRVADGKLIRTLSGHTSGVKSIVFTRDGQMLASGSNDRTIRLWRVADGKLIRTLSGHTGFVESVAFTPDGQTLASGSGDKTIRLWRISDGASLHELSGHTRSVKSIAFSADGALLASGSEDTTVRLWGLNM